MRYRIGGVCLEVRGPLGVAADEVGERYGPFRADGALPDVVVDVDLDPSFRSLHSVGRPFPGIDGWWGDDAYRFEREDLSVRLDVSTEPAVARGRARDGRGTLESVLRACLSVVLARRGVLLLHASGVVEDGRAYLFVGPSGSGKSTIVGLTGASHVLSDDIVAVRVEDGGAVACAVPFAGLAAPRPRPGDFPVEVVCMIEPGREDVLVPLPRAHALARVLGNVLHLCVRDPATPRVVDLATRLSEVAPPRRLVFRHDGAFWPALRQQGGRPLDSPLRLIGSPPATTLGESA